METDKWILETEALKKRLNLRLTRDCLKWALWENEKAGLIWLEYGDIPVPLPLLLLRFSLESMIWIEKIEAVPEAELNCKSTI